MTDHHLDAKAWEVRALLDGRKTMTRRLAWRYKVDVESGDLRWPSPWQRVKPGDRLWVKEAWQYARKQYCACPQPSEPSPCDDWHEGIGCRSDREGIVLRADGDQAPIWHPSIHMPRWASRLTLIVTATKIERLQEISDDDSLAEGVDLNGAVAGHDFNIDHEWWPGGPRRQFERLWRSLHGPDSWDANPEVIALTFRVVRANVDSAEARAA